MLAPTRPWPLFRRHNSVTTNMARAPVPKAAMNPGCQISLQVAVAVTLNSNAGRHSQTTILLISAAALSPSLLVLRHR